MKSIFIVFLRKQFLLCFSVGKELFGREIRVTLCPRRMYSMQKQNTPFNPAAPPTNNNSAIKPINTNNNNNTNTTNGTASSTTTATTTSATTTSAAATDNGTTAAASTTAATSTASTTTTTSASTSMTQANPIATISSSTLGLPRQLNHSLFKLRQTPEQQRGLLPTPPIP